MSLAVPDGSAESFPYLCGSTLTNDQLELEIASLAARIAADACRWLELVAEFDRREAHLAAGFHCCAAWLAWRCSVTGSRARARPLLSYWAVDGLCEIAERRDRAGTLERAGPAP